MVKDKREEQHAILDELETIKSLLNEDDLANIPTLNQRLPDANDPIVEIPLLTQVIDDLDESFSAFFSPRIAAPASPTQTKADSSQTSSSDYLADYTPSDKPRYNADNHPDLFGDGGGFPSVNESRQQQQTNTRPSNVNDGALTDQEARVLLNQQKLFGHDEEENLSDAFGSSGLYTTAHDSLTERPASDRSRRNGNRLSPPVKARGENPFLPKHIRDRLHTNKTLVDIIRDYPPAPEIQPHPTNHLVEELIAEFLPKIEAELRQRLLKLADEGKLETKP